MSAPIKGHERVAKETPVEKAARERDVEAEKADCLLERHECNTKTSNAKGPKKNKKCRESGKKQINQGSEGDERSRH